MQKNLNKYNKYKYHIYFITNTAQFRIIDALPVPIPRRLFHIKHTI